MLHRDPSGKEGICKMLWKLDMGSGLDSEPFGDGEVTEGKGCFGRRSGWRRNAWAGRSCLSRRVKLEGHGVIAADWPAGRVSHWAGRGAVRLTLKITERGDGPPEYRTWQNRRDINDANIPVTGDDPCRRPHGEDGFETGIRCRLGVTRQATAFTAARSIRCDHSMRQTRIPPSTVRVANRLSA